MITQLYPIIIALKPMEKHKRLINKHEHSKNLRINHLPIVDIGSIKICKDKDVLNLQKMPEERRLYYTNNNVVTSY